MAKDEPIDRMLPDRAIRKAHQSNSHGDVLILDFYDGTQLVVWAFQEPDNQQVVLWKPDSGELVLDLRSQDCKEFTDRAWDQLVERFPHLYGPGGSERKPPFKVYYRKSPL